MSCSGLWRASTGTSCRLVGVATTCLYASISHCTYVSCQHLLLDYQLPTLKAAIEKGNIVSNSGLRSLQVCEGYSAAGVHQLLVVVDYSLFALGGLAETLNQLLKAVQVGC